MSGTDTLPKWCFLLLSPCALSIQTAKSVVEAPEDAPQPAWNELQQQQLLQCIDAIFMPYLSDVPEPVQISHSIRHGSRETFAGQLTVEQGG